MKILVVTLLLSVSFYNLVFSQNVSYGTYQFLDLPNSAKVAALGGTQIALADNDLGLTFYNPSLLKDSMRNQLSANKDAVKAKMYVNLEGLLKFEFETDNTKSTYYIVKKDI